MTAKILDEKEVELITKETGINAKKILLLKNNRYYFIIVLDNAACLKISNKLAEKIK